MIIGGMLCATGLVAVAAVAQEAAMPSSGETVSEESEATPAVGETVESNTDAGAEADADAGSIGDAAPVLAAAESPKEEPEPEEPEPFVPGVESTVEVDESQFEDMPDPEENLPFAKGDMEVGVNLAMAGSGDYFYFGAGGTYAYYVIDRLAPGLEVTYTHIFLNKDYGYAEPHTMTLLPFLKFVILRSRSVAPYLVAAGGYQFEWGSKYAVNAWIAGGGAGVHVGLGEHFALNIQLLALYYWYDKTKVYLYDDNLFTIEEETDSVVDETGEVTTVKTGEKYFETNCRVESGTEICDRYYKSNDMKDEDSELFFPLITFGVAFFF